MVAGHSRLIQVDQSEDVDEHATSVVVCRVLLDAGLVDDVHVAQQGAGDATAAATDRVVMYVAIADIDPEACAVGAAAIDATAATVIRFVAGARVVRDLAADNAHRTGLARPHEDAETAAVHVVDALGAHAVGDTKTFQGDATGLNQHDGVLLVALEVRRGITIADKGDRLSQTEGKTLPRLDGVDPGRHTDGVVVPGGVQRRANRGVVAGDVELGSPTRRAGRQHNPQQDAAGPRQPPQTVCGGRRGKRALGRKRPAIPGAPITMGCHRPVCGASVR